MTDITMANAVASKACKVRPGLFKMDCMLLVRAFAEQCFFDELSMTRQQMVIVSNRFKIRTFTIQPEIFLLAVDVFKPKRMHALQPDLSIVSERQGDRGRLHQIHINFSSMLFL